VHELDRRAVHQQHPLGAREPGVHPLQRLHGVGEDQRDPVRLADRVLAGDPVVAAEPAIQIRAQGRLLTEQVRVSDLAATG
jgi:hypothetical protein